MRVIIITKTTKEKGMKRIALLTSILALTACGGGGGGGSASAPVWRPDTQITQEMLNNTDSVQAKEIAQKLKTIEYVENNLGAIIKDGELIAPTNTNRSATTNKMLAGLLLSDIESRYQAALEYFDILERVLNANADTSGEITVKDIKIAYSLSANTKYDEITQADMPSVDITQDEDTVIVDIDVVIADIQIIITENMENNDDLKDSVTEDIVEDIPVLKPEPEPEPKPDVPTDVVMPDFSKVKYFGTEDFVLSFGVKDGIIENITSDDTTIGVLTRKEGTTYVSDGYTYIVDMGTFDVYFTTVADDPRTSDAALEALKTKLNLDIQNGNCFDTCIRETSRMLEDGSYVVTKNENGSYDISFPIADEWTMEFVGKNYADKTLKNSVKEQQLLFLLERDFISSEYAAQLREDSSVTNLLDLGVCNGTQNDCESVLTAIAEGKVRFTDNQLSFEMKIDDTMGLKYASFAFIDFEMNSDAGTMIFAGGDQTKKIEKDLIVENMTFTGKAIGAAYVNTENDEDSGAYMELTTDKATLTLDAKNKSETLVLPFAQNNNYYDVTVTQDKKTGNVKFSFDNDAKVPENFKFMDSNEVEEIEDLMHTEYYGENGTPSEVSGVVMYEQESEFKEVGFQSAFGMKADK